ncbi:DUF4301 family protein, partial [Bacteroidales bacterium OttesenSCG-928-A14]|nr:DUF4301 family protein [Bacteroidales bacterium OttesenSCG-928-A14]
MSIFTPSDLTQIRERGSVVEDVEQQFAHFKTGFPYSPLNRPATVGDGIIRENHKTIASLITAYDDKMAGVKLLKFVPASGAASRMFKPLFDMLENDDPQYMEKGLQFITDLKKYPFYHDLTQALQSKNLLIDNLIAQGDYKTIIRNILFDEGLDYSQKPKALLKFHREPENEEHSRYAVEEHLVEAACYAKSKGGICHLHFTVSPHHLNDFNKIIDRVRPKYEQRFGVKYDITYSVQNPATDTLAATEDNLPFRNEDGQLLFRPGG